MDESNVQVLQILHLISQLVFFIRAATMLHLYYNDIHLFGS
jgi:hypothetical protein